MYVYTKIDEDTTSISHYFKRVFCYTLMGLWRAAVGFKCRALTNTYTSSLFWDFWSLTNPENRIRAYTFVPTYKLSIILLFCQHNALWPLFMENVSDCFLLLLRFIIYFYYLDPFIELKIKCFNYISK